MKRLAMGMVLGVMLAGCQTTTGVTISSNVLGARVYVNGNYIGNTQGDENYASIQTKMTNKGGGIIELVKDGYRRRTHNVNTEVKVINAIGGFFLLVPWIWIMGPERLQSVTMYPLKEAGATE